MQKVLIVGSSKQPIPAVKGGAVPALIEELISQNEVENQIELNCVSIYDEEALDVSQKYKNTNFIWAEVPTAVKKMDHFFYLFSKYILGGKRIHSLSFMAQIGWFSFFVAQVLKNNDFDVVVFENSIPVLSSLKMNGNRKKYKNKWFLHMHTVPKSLYGMGKIVCESRGIIVISKFVKQKMKEKFQIPDEKFSVMYNCLRNYFFESNVTGTKEAIEKRLKETIGGRKVVLFAGRLNKEKGIEEVISAVKQLNRKDIVLLIVGSNFYKASIVGTYEERLHVLTKELENQIVFTGYIDNEDMPAVYRMADVVVLPSMWDEPAGMTMIEAMASGCALITTESGGIPEYVGKNGCVLLKRDEDLIDNIAKEIEHILTDSKYSVEMKEKAKINVAQFTEKFYYRQLIHILEG